MRLAAGEIKGFTLFALPPPIVAPVALIFAEALNVEDAEAVEDGKAAVEVRFAAETPVFRAPAVALVLLPPVAAELVVLALADDFGNVEDDMEDREKPRALFEELAVLLPFFAVVFLGALGNVDDGGAEGEGEDSHRSNPWVISLRSERIDFDPPAQPYMHPTSDSLPNSNASRGE